MRSPLIVVLALTTVATACATAAAQDGSTQGLPGTTAAPFVLERLTGGKVSRDGLRGKPAVLIVGLSRKAAPLCKEWTMVLAKRFPAQSHLFTVVVAGNPWYIPRSSVRSMLRDFVPTEARHHILIDWGNQFAQDYAIERDDIPTVFLLDENGMIVWRRKGVYQPAIADALAETLGAVTGDPVPRQEPSQQAPDVSKR